jgi:hypothetical protein
MSANVPVIRLHGGPSDGLRLVWHDSECEMILPVQSNDEFCLEYDYVYLPRLATKSGPASRVKLPELPVQQVAWWQRLRRRVHQWLMTPVVYPLDFRRYRVLLKK